MILLAQELVALREVVASFISRPSSASISFIVSSRPRKPDFCMPTLSALTAS